MADNLEDIGTEPGAGEEIKQIQASDYGLPDRHASMQGVAGGPTIINEKPNQTTDYSLQSTAPKKLKSKKWFKWVLGIIILTLVGYGIWWYNQQPIQKFLTNDTNLGAEAQIKQDTHNLVTISDWGTYTNTQFGFSFKYPKVWTIYNGIEFFISTMKEPAFLTAYFLILIGIYLIFIRHH